MKKHEVPQDILDTARPGIDPLDVREAIYLYAQGWLSVDKACEPAEGTLWEFRGFPESLAAQCLSPHSDAADLFHDVSTLRSLGQR